MKKKFVEPEIVRIDLKMTENIADSHYTEGGGLLGFNVYTRHIPDACYEFYVNTNINPSSNEYTNPVDLIRFLLDNSNCFENPAAKARALMMYGR